VQDKPSWGLVVSLFKVFLVPIILPFAYCWFPVTYCRSNIYDLIFNLNGIKGSVLLRFDKNKLIINKEKSLALDFHHKSNKHIIFYNVILEDRKVTYVSEEKLFGSVARSQFKSGLSYTYLLTPWSRVLLEKLTSKLCS